MVSCAEVKGKDVSDHLPLATSDRSYYLITVSDNGIGFDQTDAARIFNVFTRLHTNEHYRGSGIGLSIVKSIIAFLGFEIKVSSVYGKWTIFSITIPSEMIEVTRPFEL